MGQAVGRLRFRFDLILQEDSVSSNANSNLIQKLTKKFTRWGNLTDVDGGRYLFTRNVNSATTHFSEIRYEAQFDNNSKLTQVQHKGRLFKILNSRILDERDRRLVFELQEMGNSSTYNVV